MSNKRTMQKITVVLLLLIIFAEFYLNMDDLGLLKDEYSKKYFLQHAYNETGAKNIVAAIYLDYRLFDSLFEAGILLITVSGITFMSRKN
ncbi:MAG: hydrogen gas-evolving membrane-bound hydrogenase subunit E [Bacillota bacterium]